MTEYTLNFDGGSTGNPGLSGAGAVIYNRGEEVWSGAFYVGSMETNNTAEYHGLIHGLEEAINMSILDLVAYGDSALVINQVNGTYKVKSCHLKPLYDRVMVLVGYFNSIQFKHVPRKLNKRADELSNLGRIIK